MAGQGEQPEQSREVWQPQADVCALRKDAHSSLRRAECAGEAAAAQGRGEVLEEAEKRKEAAVKNRIKGHKKKNSFAQKMCCSWRSHRAEPGQLSPSPLFSSSPSPFPTSMGLEDSPGTAHRKLFPLGISTGEGGDNMGKKGELTRDAPMGSVQAELRAVLGGGSQPDVAKAEHPYFCCTLQCVAPDTRAFFCCQTQKNTTMAQAAGTQRP